MAEEPAGSRAGTAVAGVVPLRGAVTRAERAAMKLRQLHRRLFPRRLNRVFDILHGRELDVPEFAVRLFDLAQVDVVNDIARFWIDGHWPARARCEIECVALAG